VESARRAPTGAGANPRNLCRVPRSDGPMTVLVAGGTGFIGRAVTGHLLDAGVRTIVMGRGGGRRSGGRADFRAGDVTQPETLPPALKEVETVVACVQFTGFPVEAPALGRTFMEVDARGTRALARAAAEAGVGKFVYVSGVGADPRSPRPWYRAKGLAEQAVMNQGMDWCVVRPSWVYGPGDRTLNRLALVLRMTPLVFPQIGGGTQRIAPVHIADLAGLIAQAATGPAGDGAVLEAGGSEVLTMNEIVHTVARVLGQRRHIVPIPLSVVKAAAAISSVMPGQLLSPGAVDFVVQDGVADLRAVRECFPDWAPRSLETGLREYL